MYVRISGDAARPGATVGEPDDLTRLHVEAGTFADDVVRAALERAGLGTLDEAGHAWLRVAALREHAAVEDPARAGRFDRMIAYAGGQGWLDDTGEQVRAHVLRTP